MNQNWNQNVRSRACLESFVVQNKSTSNGSPLKYFELERWRHHQLDPRQNWLALKAGSNNTRADDDTITRFLCMVRNRYRIIHGIIIQWLIESEMLTSLTSSFIPSKRSWSKILHYNYLDSPHRINRLIESCYDSNSKNIYIRGNYSCSGKIKRPQLTWNLPYSHRKFRV